MRCSIASSQCTNSCGMVLLESLTQHFTDTRLTNSRFPNLLLRRPRGPEWPNTDSRWLESLQVSRGITPSSSSPDTIQSKTGRVPTRSSEAVRICVKVGPDRAKAGRCRLELVDLVPIHIDSGQIRTGVGRICVISAECGMMHPAARTRPNDGCRPRARMRLGGPPVTLHVWACLPDPGISIADALSRRRWRVRCARL